MKEYIEKSLRVNIEITGNKELPKRLPLYYEGSYDFYSVFLYNIEWIIMQPKTTIRLSRLRRDIKQTEETSGMNCAFYFTNINYYSKEKMMDDGIPFIIENKQIYLPFIGILLEEKYARELTPVSKISFLTQKILLCALYEQWNGLNVTAIADKMNVTKMSVSRCLDEIEYFGIDVLDTSGKNRTVRVDNDKYTVWNNIKDYLRNPVIAKYDFAEDINLNRKAGISALCEYSLLSDNNYPTYGITKKDLKYVNLKEHRQVPPGEEIGCRVLELGYFIDYNDENIQDPYSVLLSLDAEEKKDERVEIAVEEMLREYVM